MFRTLGEFDALEVAVRAIPLARPLEAINGALMIGFSTAVLMTVLMTVLQDVYRKKVAARRGYGR